MTALPGLPLTFISSILAAILKNRIHANTIRHFLSFYRGGCFRQLLYSFQEGSGMGVGELLDRRGLVLVVDRSAAGGLADGAAFYGDHRAGVGGGIWVDVLWVSVVGGWGSIVWFGGAVFGDVAWEFGVAGVHVGIWGACACYLLQYCPDAGKDLVPRSAVVALGADSADGGGTLFDRHLYLRAGGGNEGKGIA